MTRATRLSKAISATPRWWRVCSSSTSRAPSFTLPQSRTSTVAITGPEAFLHTNIDGTFTLLQAALQYWRQLPPEEAANFRFLHVSTDEVYGTLTPDAPAFHEDTPYAPNSPYAASKAASDHLVRAWHHTYGLPTLITNCSNNYGPLHFPEKLIPLVIINALAGKPLPIYGDGAQVRDWLYVRDHCSAIGACWRTASRAKPTTWAAAISARTLRVVTQICALLDELQPASAHVPARAADAPCARPSGP